MTNLKPKDLQEETVSPSQTSKLLQNLLRNYTEVPLGGAIDFEVLQSSSARWREFIKW